MIDYPDSAVLLALTRVAGGMHAPPSIRNHLIRRGWITPDQHITENGKRHLTTLEGHHQ